jgi:molybdate transport system regulatory protein
MAKVTITIALKSGFRLGPGKAALLKSVQETGSISAAARTMGMDYKRAWMLIDSINRAFKMPSVERVTGGTGGGGATLTPFGIELLALYHRIDLSTSTAISPELVALEQQAAPDPGPKI